MLAVWALVLYYWPALPERVPSHFGASGRPDAWSGRNFVLFPAIVPTVLYLGLTVLSFFPRIYNYPVPITPENAARQYGLARSLVIVLKALLAWTFAAIVWKSLQTAVGQAEGLGAWPWIMLAGVAAAVGIYMAKAFTSR